MDDGELRAAIVTPGAARKRKVWLFGVACLAAVAGGGIYGAVGYAEALHERRADLCNIEGAFTAKIMRMQYETLGGVLRQEALAGLKADPPSYMDSEEVEAYPEIFDRAYASGREHYSDLLPTWKHTFFSAPDHEHGWTIAANVSRQTYLECMS